MNLSNYLHPGELIRASLAEYGGNAVLIADQSMLDELKPTVVEKNLPLVAWQGNARDILDGIPGDPLLVICSLVREEAIFQQFQEELAPQKRKITVIRLVRDLFRRYSYHLGRSPKPEREWKTYPGKTRGYIIFAQQRTGSTFLSNILKKTRKLGNPQEHLQENIIPYFAMSGLDFRDWLEGLFRYSFTANGYAGTKIITTHFLEVMKTTGLQPEDFKEVLADKEIFYLRRLNRIRQAISFAKARRSGVWHIKDGREIRATRKEMDRNIDTDTLEEIMDWMEQEDSQMQDFFRRAGIRPVELYYEVLADTGKYKAELKRVSELLSPGDTPVWPEPDYLRMADDHTESLARKYIAEKYEQLLSRGLDSPLPEHLLASIMDEYQRSGQETASGNFWDYFRLRRKR
jgi:LPS sulfotransferase NodH